MELRWKQYTAEGGKIIGSPTLEYRVFSAVSGAWGEWKSVPTEHVFIV